MTRAALLTPAEAANESGLSEEVILRFVDDGVVVAKRAWANGAVRLLIPSQEVEIMTEVAAALRAEPNSYVAWGWPKSKVSGIYFAMAGDFVKIGHAANIRNRLRALQTAVPQDLRLICWQPGTQADERKLHSRFEADRVRGEWFRLEGPVGVYIGEYTRFYWGIRFE